MRFFIAAILLSMFVTADATHAQQLLETSGDWRIFSASVEGRTLCYAASVPTGKTGNYTKRGDPFLMVTGRSASTDEVSVAAGYPYKEGSEVTLTIDGTAFSLFTKGERAWAFDGAQDDRMIAAMMRGNTLTAKGTSPRGTYSLDTYSLKGFTKAHQRMKALCR
jgi:hypothetical protein